MRKILAFALICFLGAISVGAAMAQDRPIDFSSKGANVFSAPGGQSLTLPSQASPPAVVADFLRAQAHLETTVGSLVTTSEGRVARTGITHLRFAQEVEGLTVYGTYVKAAVNDAGELVHLIENLATPPSRGVLRGVIDEREALDAALNEVHPGVFVTLSQGPRDGNSVRFSGDAFFYQDPTVTRVAIPMQGGGLQEGYLVETWTQDDNLLHHTLVGGAGRVLQVELRTANDSYNIFPDHPGNSTQTATAGPGAGNAESPSGWLFGSDQTTVNISGNNVHAYLDTDNNGAPDGGGSTVDNGIFDTSANLNDQPDTIQNKAVAGQNLFYFNNVIHDKLYSHGFVESAGNFQEDNFGKGGNGSDSVNAEAQDGSGTNNANFSTPNDGSNPRMQMYIWTLTSPNRDGDVDSDIIWHEYGHGLTWRMIGNMSGPMSGAIGEGMSDVLSILINGNDVVGEYSTNDLLGIRSAPYTNYTRTYGDFSGSSVHFNGEIYAAIGWRLGELFNSDSVSRDFLFDYIVGGMNFTPSKPAFEDMRDGILQAASGSGHECLVWEAFAAFGVGEGADSRVRGGGPFGGNVTITESFDLPAACSGPIENQAPFANAGPDQTITSFSVTVNLNGGNSGDPDGDDITYAWILTSVPEGSAADLDDATSVTPSFTADLAGTYVAQLVVTDNSGLWSPADSVTITVSDGGGPNPIVDADGCSPSSGSLGQRMTVTVSGSGFQAGATVDFGQRITVQGVNFVGDTRLDVRIKVHNRAASGSRDVTVTNPDGESGTSASCFTVN